MTCAVCGRIAVAFLLMMIMMLTMVTANRADARKIRFMNESGAKVEVYWINRWQNDERVLNTDDGVFTGAETVINSYVGHEFEVVELPSKKTGTCGGENDECRTAIFQVNANDDQLVTILRGIVLEHSDNQSRARDEATDMVQECKAQAAERTNLSPMEQFQQLASCMNDSVNASLAKKTEEMEFQSTLRKDMGERLETYACLDDKMNTTDAMENRTYTLERRLERKRALPVRVLFDRPASKIHLLEGFVTADECLAVENAVKLQRVDGANGLYALKGGVSIPLEDKNGLLIGLTRRMYHYATEQLGMRGALEPDEQSESVFAIQYDNDGESPDKYDAHCDGPCDGAAHKEGERIATFILYCAAPTKGGSTHFPNAGVHVKPTVGNALFVSYYDPIEHTTDTGFTKHAGCSVQEGTKKILTHKIRL